MKNHIKNFVQFAPLKKVMAWAAMLSLMSTMLVSIPLMAQAAPTAVGNGTYFANNGGGQSDIVLQFSEALNAGDGVVDCGASGLTVCFEKTSVIKADGGGGAWTGGSTIDAVGKMPGDGTNTQMVVRFIGPDVIVNMGAGPTITIPSGIAGVTAPQVFNVVPPPTKGGDAQYTDDAGGNSIITASFNAPLNPGDGAEACAEGSSFTNCFDKTKVTATGGGWNGTPTIIDVGQDPQLDNMLVIVYAGTGVISNMGAGPTLTVASGIGGVAMQQVFDVVLPPPAVPEKFGNANYLADVGGVSAIPATFTSNLNQSEGTVACSEGSPFATCYDKSSVVLGGGGWNGTPTIGDVGQDAQNLKGLIVEFTTAGVISNIGASPTISFPAGIAGIAAPQVFDVVAAPPPAPVKQGDASYFGDDGSGNSVVFATFSIALNVDDGSEACDATGLDNCFDETKVTATGDGWDGVPVILDVGISDENPDLLVVAYEGTDPISNLGAGPTLTVAAGIGGVVVPQVFDIVLPAPPSGPEKLGDAQYTADTDGRSSLLAIFDAVLDGVKGVVACPEGSPFTVCYDKTGVVLGGGGWDGTPAIDVMAKNPGNGQQMFIVFTVADVISNIGANPTISIPTSIAGIVDPQVFDIGLPPAAAPIVCENDDPSAICEHNDGDAASQLPLYIDGDVDTGSHIQGPNHPIIFTRTFDADTAIREVTITHNNNGGNNMKTGLIEWWNAAAQGGPAWVGFGDAIDDDGVDKVITVALPAESPDIITNKIRITNTANWNPPAGWHPTEFSFRGSAPSAIVGDIEYYELNKSYLEVTLDEPLSQKINKVVCPGINPGGSICWDKGSVIISGTSLSNGVSTASIVKVVRTPNMPANKVRVVFNTNKLFDNYDDLELSLNGFGNITGGPLTSGDFVTPATTKASDAKAEYTASTGGGESLVDLNFRAQLTNAGGDNATYCPELDGLIAEGTLCYNPVLATLGGNGWDPAAEVAYIIRNGDEFIDAEENSEDPTALIVVLNMADAILNLEADPVPTIGFDGFGGIVAEQVYEFAKPPTPEAEGDGEYSAAGDSFLVDLGFDASLSGQGALESCPEQVLDEGAVCYNINDGEGTDYVELLGTGWEIGAEPLIVVVGSEDDATFVVVFGGPVIPSFEGVDPQISVDFIGGVEDQVFDIVPDDPGGGDPPGGPPVFQSAWMETDTEVRVEFDNTVTQQNVDGSTFTLDVNGAIIDADSATVVDGHDNEVDVVFTNALAAIQVTKIEPGPNGYLLTISSGLADGVPIESDFDEDGGWFGPPIVINEVNTDPQQDWSSVSFNYATNNDPAGTPSAVAGAQNDQYIELRINDASPDSNFWGGIVTGDSVDLTKLRIQVFDDDWNLVAACDLSAGPGCPDVEGENKFNTVLYAGDGTFGSPANGDVLILANPDASLPKDNLHVEVMGQMSGMFIADVAFGNINGNADWNAPYPDEGIGTDKEAVGLDDKGTSMGAWDEDYAYQHASPLADNTYSSPFGVMGVFPCESKTLCMDFNKAVDIETLTESNFAVLQHGTDTPAQCAGGACVIEAIYREGGGGRFVSLSFTTAMVAGGSYDLVIVGGNNGVKDVDGGTIQESAVVYSFSGYEVDTTPPQMTNVNVHSPSEIEIMFDEHNGLNTSSANLSVPGLTIGNYWEDWDRLSLQFTGNMTAGVEYTFTITGLEDDEGNVLTTNNSISFAGFDGDMYDDNQSPYITNTKPYNYEWEVPTNLSTIQIEFSERLDSGTIEDEDFVLRKLNEFNYTTTSVADLGDDYVSYDADTQTVTIDIPEDELDASSFYELEIQGGSSGPKDLSGGDMQFGAEYYYFYTSSGADTNEPTIYYSTLDDYSGGTGIVGVPTGVGIITVFFDESMDGDTIKDSDPTDPGSNIELTYNLSGSTTQVNGEVYYHSGSSSAEFHISEPLNANTDYTFTVKTGVTDAAGNALSGQFSRSFQTDDIDETEPQVDFAEFDGSTMWIQFSEAMKASSVQDMNNFDFVFGGEGFADKDGLISEYDPWENRLEIRGFNDIDQDSSFALSINDLMDAAGNQMSSNAEYTGAGYNPDEFQNMVSIMEASPSWGDWDVPTNIKTASAKFDIGLDSSTVTTTSVQLVKEGDENTNLCTSVQYKSASQTVTCALNASLDSYSYYIWKLGRDPHEPSYSSTIKDENGSAMPWAEWIFFETGGAADNDSPEVSFMQPSDGAEDVSVGAGMISIFFTEDMDSSSFTSSTLTMYPTSDNSAPVSGKREYYSDGWVVDFFPEDPLSPNTEYTIALSGDVKDRGGNALAATTKTFTTGDADLAAPTVAYMSATNWEVQIQFSEVVKEDTAVNPKNYTLYSSSTVGGAPDQRVSLEGKEFEYDPFSGNLFIYGLNLNEGMTLNLEAKNIKDLAGNWMVDDDSTNIRAAEVLDLNYQDEAPWVNFGWPNGWDEPTNIPSIGVEFSEAMDPDTIDANSFKVFPHICNNYYACSDGAALTADEYTFDTDTNTAFFHLIDQGNGRTLTPDQEYHVVVTTDMKDGGGQALRSWDMWNKDNNMAYDFYFHTNNSAEGDTSAPQIWGTSLDEYWDWQTETIQGVQTYIWGIEIPFSKQMSSSTINDLNAGNTDSNIYVKNASTDVKVAGSVEYDSGGRFANWKLEDVLSPNTAYQLVVTTGVTDLMGNALDEYTQNFTTANTGADEDGPEITWFDINEYSLRIWFNEPVNKDEAEILRNYTLSTCEIDQVTAQTCLNNLNIYPLTSMDGISIHYNEWENMTEIEGLAVKEGNIAAIGVDIEDRAGNTIKTTEDSDEWSGRSIATPLNTYNTFENYIMPYFDEYYAFDDWDDSQVMFNMFAGGANVSPENRLAGAESIFWVDFSAMETIPDGGQIRIKFPRGFDVTNVGAVPVFAAGGDGMMSSVNQDINGWGDGAITIDSVSRNTSTRTVTMVINGATQPMDFISLDLKGIRNPSTASDVSTEGYIPIIETYDADGQMQESIEAEPIYIEPKGSGKIVVQVDATGLSTPPDNGEQVTVHVNSMSGAHFSEELTFDGTNMYGTVTVPSLPEGDYDVYMDGYVVLDVGGEEQEYFGQGGSFVWLGDGATENVSLSLIAAEGDDYGDEGGDDEWQTLTITASGGPSSEQVDLRIFGEGYFFEKESEFSVLGNISEEMTVPQGFYTVSLDPWMPKGFFMGPPPAASFMSPSPQDVKVNGEGAEVAFTIKKAENYVKVTVVDDNGNAIPNAHVFVAPAMFGASFGGGVGGETGEDGTFTAAVAPGWYEVDVHKAGMPSMPRQDVIIDDEATSENPEAVEFRLKVPAIKVSGTLTKNNKAVANQPVFGNAVDSNGNWLPQFFDTHTDGNGKYSFYADASTNWNVCGWVMGFGEICKTVNIGTINLTGQNINLNEDNFVEVTGTLKYGSGEGVGLADASVFAESVDGAAEHSFSEVRTNSAGEFTLRVAAGEYELGTFNDEFGHKIFKTDLDVSDGNSEVLGDVFVTTNDTKEVSIRFVNGSGYLYEVSEAFVDIFSDETGSSNFVELNGLSEKTIKLEAGTGYEAYAFVAEIGALPGQSNITVGDSTIITFEIGEKVDLSGSVESTGEVDGPVANAKLKFTDPANDYSQEVSTDDNGDYSISVPANSSYTVKIQMKDYLPFNDTVTVENSNVSTEDFVIETADKNVGIRGAVTADGTLTSNDARVVATDSTGKDRTVMVDDLGDYSFAVAPGTWTIKAYKDGYETTAGNVQTVVVTTGMEDVDVAMTAIAGYTVLPPSSYSVVPANGGIIQHENPAMTITIPAEAMGDGNQSYSVSVKKTSEMIDTAAADPILDQGVDISISDNNGVTVSGLGKAIKIEYDYTDAGLTADQIDDMSCGHISSSEDSNWEATTCRLHQDDDELKMIYSTKEFSIFGAVDWSDDVAPSAPTGLSAIGNNGYVALDWNNSSDVDFMEYLVFRGTSSGFTANDASQINTTQVTASAYTDTSVTEGTTYYYTVKTVDTSGNESSVSSERSATPTGSTEDLDEDEIVEIFGGGLDTEEYVWAEIVPAVVVEMDFSNFDFIGHWAEDYIKTVVSLGIASGLSENVFQPDWAITRAELTKMVLVAAGEDISTVSSTSFTDVEPSDWYAPYVEAAKDIGVVEGYEDGTFRPNDSINRVEALKILIEGGLDIDILVDEESGLLATFELEENPFTDLTLSDWFAKYVLYAYVNDIVAGYGDGTFGPANGMTRAEFSKVLTLALELE